MLSEPPVDVRTVCGLPRRADRHARSLHSDLVELRHQIAAGDLPGERCGAIVDDPRVCRRLARRNRRGNSVGFALGRMILRADRNLSPRLGTLLRDVRELVRHQRDVGRALARSEEHVVAVRECTRLDRRGAGGRVLVGVHSDIAERDPELQLDEFAHAGIDRLPAALSIDRILRDLPHRGWRQPARGLLTSPHGLRERPLAEPRRRKIVA
ncbi:MAG TPA: hypothetical protein VN253_03220 [Kofleriaceae bacterium]|nr:hypothetical protein [Kofleriaceae bacterium]